MDFSLRRLCLPSLACSGQCSGRAILHFAILGWFQVAPYRPRGPRFYRMLMLLEVCVCVDVSQRLRLWDRVATLSSLRKLKGRVL